VWALLQNFTYDCKKVRKLVFHMIIYHECPFVHIKHVLFNEFMMANTSHWQKISSAIAKNDCISTYEIENKKLKTLLWGVDKVNITIDMWNSVQKASYMVLTCNFFYYYSYWFLEKWVLNFCNLLPLHIIVLLLIMLIRSVSQI